MIDDDETKTTSAAIEWHGATDEEHRAAVSHALKLRPWENRPGKADEMTPGEMLFYVLSPHSDEPFLRGVLAMVVQELGRCTRRGTSRPRRPACSTPSG